ncbi:porin [Sulfitobacter mediterraneus]|uniref:porin n=1 Tax=Sulfitobacter mediterraneus TaxID=83219 RepID=UPI001931B83C|nr:porin [Sulfitobacter mediterraneus]MBM1308916.1 porin [Sulfitobacter mediterraneus]MBM1312801.1 porin [Sulfitobacter mediterraneus]MBM1321183.1 porin [Sulfitobacter mediterraneus]MBM1325070.1 porin [Sulfitobacter mediterraneus]MBM1396417.1 porin [Sulfitobacter mediterraneus]
MKKVLFATTALVATAGVAAADVTFGGWGRFGILYNEANVGNETNITSRFRLQIDATAESDGGVTFGARVRMQQNNTDDNRQPAVAGSNSPAGTGFNGARFFARSGGLEVGVGNIYGAIEFMPGMYPIDLGLTGLGYEYTAYQFRADAYSSGGNGSAGSNGVEVLYSMGDLSFHVSASDTNDRIAAHVAYSWNGWTFALGAQDSNNAADTELAASVGGSFGPVDVTLAYADNGTAGDHITLAGRFDVGAATNVEVYVADADNFANTSYGVDFNHDLGGGTSLRGGIASLSNDTVRADLGVRFNF